MVLDIVSSAKAAVRRLRFGSSRPVVCVVQSACFLATTTLRVGPIATSVFVGLLLVVAGVSVVSVGERYLAVVSGLLLLCATGVLLIVSGNAIRASSAAAKGVRRSRAGSAARHSVRRLYLLRGASTGTSAVSSPGGFGVGKTTKR